MSESELQKQNKRSKALALRKWNHLAAQWELCSTLYCCAHWVLCGLWCPDNFHTTARFGWYCSWPEWSPPLHCPWKTSLCTEVRLCKRWTYTVGSSVCFQEGISLFTFAPCLKGRWCGPEIHSLCSSRTWKIIRAKGRQICTKGSRNVILICADCAGSEGAQRCSAHSTAQNSRCAPLRPAVTAGGWTEHLQWFPALVMPGGILWLFTFLFVVV